MSKAKTEVNIEGLTKLEALVALGAAGFDAKAAKEYYEANKPEPVPPFKARFYAELAEGPMSVERFEALIAGESDNIRAHRSAHLAVFEMANAIWAK
jgi:hypothetical protein